MAIARGSFLIFLRFPATNHIPLGFLLAVLVKMPIVLVRATRSIAGSTACHWQSFIVMAFSICAYRGTAPCPIWLDPR